MYCSLKVVLKKIVIKFKMKCIEKLSIIWYRLIIDADTPARMSLSFHVDRMVSSTMLAFLVWINFLKSFRLKLSELKVTFVIQSNCSNYRNSIKR